MGGLSRKESEVSVIVDGRERRFRLRSHSITKQLEQLEVQERGRRLGLDLSEDSFASETTITDANRAYLASIEPVILWLLRDPVDGGKPLTSARARATRAMGDRPRTSAGRCSRRARTVMRWLPPPG